MDRKRVVSLFASRKLTAAKRDTLLRLVDEGVNDPFRAGESAAVCKLWLDHLPSSKSRRGGVVDALNLVMECARSSQAKVHREVASMLRRYDTCEALDNYVKEWMHVTRNVVVLEAVVWGWMLFEEAETADENVVASRALYVAEAATDPGVLMRLLSAFRRRFSLKGTVRPRAVVDTLALQQGWWVVDSPGRCDAIVDLALDEALDDGHEWVPIDDVALRSDGVSEEELITALRRLGVKGSVACVPGGVTRPHILETSRAVKRLAAAFGVAPPAEELGSQWSIDVDQATMLNREQRALVDHVCAGNRLTLCCAPAGTGKTHTARSVALAVPEGGKVLCLAPTWKAVSVLRERLSGVEGVSFSTTQGFVMLAKPPEAALVLVDETSMLAMHQIRCVLESYVDARTTRILMLGDDAQLPPIGRGLPIRDVQAAIHTVRLVSCMRTDGRGLVEAARSARNQQPVRAVDGEVLRLPTSHPVDAIKEKLGVVDGGGKVIMPWEPGYVQMISPQNKHVDLLNEMVQSQTTARGEGARVFSGCYVGDAVRCLKNTDTYKNGDEGTLVKLCEGRKRGRGGKERDGGRGGGDTGVVRLRDGQEVTVASGHVAPAYATTVHKVQGSEYDTVAVVLFHGTRPSMRTREILYTSVTRARKTLLLVGDLEAMERAVSEERRTVFAFV